MLKILQNSSMIQQWGSGIIYFFYAVKNLYLVFRSFQSLEEQEQLQSQPEKLCRAFIRYSLEIILFKSRNRNSIDSNTKMQLYLKNSGQTIILSEICFYTYHFRQKTDIVRINNKFKASYIYKFTINFCLMLIINNDLMNKSFSEFESSRQYQILIENCLLKCLSSSQKVLQQSVSTSLRKKIQQIFSLNMQNNDSSRSEPVIVAIQHFILTLLELIQSLSKNLSLSRQRPNYNLNNSQTHKQEIGYESNDYQSLQKCIQKAQSDIRKHIRCQQQMKIYINDLEDKAQMLSTQVKNQKKRNQQLFKNIASINKQKRQVQQKFRKLQNKLGTKIEKKNLPHSKPSKVMSEALFKEQLHMYRSSLDKNDVLASGISVPRKKSLIEKMNDRSKKLGKKQSLHSNNLIFVDGSINVNLENSHYSKNLKKDNKNSFEEIKDNIKTIELNQQSKKPIVRRVVRLQTQGKETKVQKKHQRSSSVLE